MKLGTRRILRLAAVSALAAVTLAAGLSGPARAGDPYYKGRTITLLVGWAAGGPTDLAARLFAKEVADKIPGKPNVIVKNMPGAGSMKAHNYVFQVAKGDGETYLIGPWFPVSQILSMPGVNFRYEQFSLVAAFNSANFLVYGRNDAVSGGMKRASDIVKAKNLKFAGIAPNFTFDLLGRLSLELLGVHYTYITGYHGSAEMRPALMRNEANIAVDTDIGYRTGIEPTLVKEGIARAYWSLPVEDDSGAWVRPSQLSEMPTINEVYKEAFGKDPAGVQWETMKLVLTYLSNMNQVLLGPPSLNKTALTVMRKASYDLLNDKAFQAECTKRLSRPFAPVAVARAEQIVQSLKNIDPTVRAHLKAHVESGKKVKQ